MGYDRFAKELGRDTDRASRFLDVMVRTLVLANAPDDEGLFTRWTNPMRTGRCTGRPLRFVAERVRAAIKFTADRLGLDPAHFSAHSWRKGGAAIMTMSGVPARFIEARGTWAKGSVVMRQVYVHPFTAPVGPMGSAAADYDTVAEREGLLRAVAKRQRKA
jgi:integrase